MADPTLTNKFLIAIGDAGDPETFGAPCGANARTFKFTRNTGEEVLLDCADPLGVQPGVTRWVESIDSEITIAGRLSREAFPTWQAWLAATGDAQYRNVRVELDNNTTDGGGYWQFRALLTELEFSGEGSAMMSVSATIMGAGTPVWTAAT